MSDRQVTASMWGWYFHTDDEGGILIEPSDEEGRGEIINNVFEGVGTTQYADNPYYRLRSDRDEAEVRELREALTTARQTLWDVYRILGFDTDGQPTGEACGDLNKLLLDAAREQRKDYDDACDEAHTAEGQRDALLSALTAWEETCPPDCLGELRRLIAEHSPASEQRNNL